MKPLISLLIPCLVLPVAACSADLPTTATSNEAKVAQGNNAFAIELYGRLRKQSGNLFFSPESISTALAMTYAGARAILDILLTGLDQEREGSESDVDRVTALSAELRMFHEDIEAGRA